MGHAGAIVQSNCGLTSEGKGDAPSKIKSLTEAGIRVASSPAQLGKTILEAMGHLA